MCKTHIMLNALDHLFAALARLLLARGVGFPDLAERMKRHYVNAAKSAATGKPTDSRLSVMTGLQRRDIARLRSLPRPAARPNHLARIVALWQNVPGYHDDGTPRALPKNGPAPSFEALAREVRRDVHPRTLLDSLAEAGTVTIAPDTQMIHLTRLSYQPSTGSDDQIAYLASNLGDHISAATENVAGITPPHFERAVHYSGLTEQQVDQLAADYHDAQMAIMKEISRKASRMKADNKGTGTIRFRAGGYFFRTNEDAQ